MSQLFSPPPEKAHGACSISRNALASSKRTRPNSVCGACWAPGKTRALRNGRPIRRNGLRYRFEPTAPPGRTRPKNLFSDPFVTWCDVMPRVLVQINWRSVVSDERSVFWRVTGTRRMERHLTWNWGRCQGQPDVASLSEGSVPRFHCTNRKSRLGFRRSQAETRISRLLWWPGDHRAHKPCTGRGYRWRYLGLGGCNTRRGLHGVTHRVIPGVEDKVIASLEGSRVQTL